MRDEAHAPVWGKEGGEVGCWELGEGEGSGGNGGGGRLGRGEEGKFAGFVEGREVEVGWEGGELDLRFFGMFVGGVRHLEGVGWGRTW